LIIKHSSWKKVCEKEKTVEFSNPTVLQGAIFYSPGTMQTENLQETYSHYCVSNTMRLTPLKENLKLCPN